MAPVNSAKLTLASPRSTPLKLELSNLASSRVADLKLTPVKSKPENHVFDKSTPVKSAPLKSATYPKLAVLKFAQETPGIPLAVPSP